MRRGVVVFGGWRRGLLVVVMEMNGAVCCEMTRERGVVVLWLWLWLCCFGCVVDSCHDGFFLFEKYPCYEVMLCDLE